MRITSFDKFDMSQIRLSKIQQYSNELQVQITTGKEYQKISQSPVKANASILVNTGLKRIDQFQANLADLQGYVQTSESYLGIAEEDFQRAMELSVQAGSGTYSDGDKQSFVQELESIIQHMVALGNSKHLDKYLFAGQATDTAPLVYDGATVAYTGSDDVNSIRITSNMDVKVSVTADEAFVGTIEALIDLRDAIDTGTSTDVANAATDLRAQGESILNARSEMGVRMNTVEMVNDAYDQNKLELETRKSKAEDVDVAEAITKFVNAQNLYQGTIQATMKMYESSLLNYI